METALHRIKSRAGRACRNERLLAAVERVNDARRSGLPDPYTDPRDARALARLLAVRAKESTPDAVRVGPECAAMHLADEHAEDCFEGEGEAAFGRED